MKTLRILACITLVGACTNGSLGQENLPRPEHRFDGAVGPTFKDSEPAAFPQPIKAPNVLLVLFDDCGFGQFSVTRMTRITT